MTAPNRLHYRRLEPGRGRAWMNESGLWCVDYRAPDSTLYGTLVASLADACDWVRWVASDHAAREETS